MARNQCNWKKAFSHSHKIKETVFCHKIKETVFCHKKGAVVNHSIKRAVLRIFLKSKFKNSVIIFQNRRGAKGIIKMM